MNSLATVRAHAPGARLFRAFSNLGWENFAEPVFDGVQADLFYCGDSGQARTTVEALIADVGLRPVYVGDLDQVPVIDSLTRLWFALALQQGYGRHMAFKMLKG
jgi:predicted dinucleotide-binding enzyme